MKEGSNKDFGFIRIKGQEIKKLTSAKIQEVIRRLLSYIIHQKKF